MTLRLGGVGLTDRGRARARNEDGWLLVPSLGIAAVADGMGGHRAGDVASALALDALGRSIAAEERSGSRLDVRLTRAVVAADRRIRVEASADPARLGMGTTLTALGYDPEANRLLVAHVGDSRAYRYGPDGLRRITRDHSWVQEQIDAGRLDPKEARGHPYGSVLTRALGVGEEAGPDLSECVPEASEIFLLCTDGLTNMLTDEAIGACLAEALPVGLEEAAKALIEAANEAGGADNVTVVLASIREG